MPDQQIDLLISQLHDTAAGSPDLQFKAAINLGKLRDSPERGRITAALVKALGGGYQALTRAHAAEALGLLGETSAVDALIAALSDDYQLVRSYGARSLGKLQDPRAIPRLIEILGKDTFFGARAEAAEALGTLCRASDKDTAEVHVSKEAGRAALERYRQEEQDRLKRKAEEGRSQRVLNEINTSLGRLGRLVSDARKALLEGSDDLAAALLTEVEEEMQRMGALTK